MPIAYPVRLDSEDGELIVTARDLPELLTSGKDQAEALEMAEDALAVVLLTYMQDGKALPAPSRPEPGELIVFPPVDTAAKLAVWEAFLAAGISKSELARRMGVAPTEAMRILDPNHNTKIERLAEAARALGSPLYLVGPYGDEQIADHFRRFHEALNDIQLGTLMPGSPGLGLVRTLYGMFADSVRFSGTQTASRWWPEVIKLGERIDHLGADRGH